MKKIGWYPILMGCGLLFAGLSAQAQDDSATDWVKHDIGKWKAELKMWPQGESGDPIVFHATENNEMLGDNWIVSSFEGEFGGQAFEGHGVYGFDTKKNCFVATWVDSVNGFMSHYEGKLDVDSNSLELFGKEIDPNTGELVDGKQIRSFKSNDSRLVISYQKPAGADEFVKVMEMTFTRRK